MLFFQSIFYSNELKIYWEVKEFIKEILNIEVEIGKTFETQTRGSICTMMAGLASWPRK